MAVAGLMPRAPPAAAAAAALLFALRAHGAAEACGLRVRAGVHAGPVTSGLIGVVRARFCLFGSSVNASSRLESAGTPGAVHCSASTWAMAALPTALVPHAPRQLQLKGIAEPMDVCLLPAGSAEAARAETLLEDVVLDARRQPAEAVPADVAAVIGAE